MSGLLVFVIWKVAAFRLLVERSKSLSVGEEPQSRREASKQGRESGSAGVCA